MIIYYGNYNQYSSCDATARLLASESCVLSTCLPNTDALIATGFCGMSTVESHQLTASVLIWQCYDSTVKAELFSSAIGSSSGSFLVDPIAPQPAELKGMFALAKPAAV